MTSWNRHVTQYGSLWSTITLGGTPTGCESRDKTNSQSTFTLTVQGESALVFDREGARDAERPRSAA
jgi:hypothetical protein